MRVVVIAAETAAPSPTKVINVIWAEPPNMMMELDQPNRWGTPDSTTMTPKSSANGRAGKNSGNISLKAALTMGDRIFMRGVYANCFAVAHQRLMYTQHLGGVMDSTTVTKPAVHAVMTANHVNPKLLTNSCQRRQLRTSGLNPVSGLSQDASIEGVTVT